jgi:hypothetical protein
MVQRTEVVRAADQRARRIVEEAQSTSQQMRHETEDFVDQRLASFEILLDRLAKTVAAGREKLAIGVPRRSPPPDPEQQPSTFFDQDRSQ